MLWCYYITLIETHEQIGQHS